MMEIRFTWMYLFWVLCVACELPTDVVPPDAYRYTSYDSTGTAVAEGWFVIRSSGMNTLSGEWHFKPVGTPRDIGPQIGDGVLTGGVDSTAVWLELNPQFRDHNVQLRGTVDGGRFSGRWFWISFVGITNAGTFEAVKP